MMRGRRAPSAGSFLMLLNILFIFLNGAFWISTSISRGRGSDTHHRGGEGGTVTRGEELSPGAGGDAFSILKQKNHFSNKAAVAEEQLKVLRTKYTSLEKAHRRCTLKMQKKANGVEDATEEDTDAQPGSPSTEVVVTPCPATSSVVDVSRPTPATTPQVLQRPFLIIGMPTVPRKDEEGKSLKDCLLFRTLISMVAEIQGTAFEPAKVVDVVGAAHSNKDHIHAPGGGVRIVVMNNRPGEHNVFSSVAEYFRDEAKISFIDFIERPSGGNGNSGTPKYVDNAKKPFASEFVGSNKEKPTPKVRRQTLDVVALLDSVVGRSKYFYFTEDDFEFCGTTLTSLHYMIYKANIYQPRPEPWTGIRCSFGLNGILMHNDPLPISSTVGVATAEFNKYQGSYPDLTYFRDYLLEHFNRRPPDHLVVEWYAKESQQAKRYFGASRTVMAFRYNVAKHTGGRQSTLREETAWSFPGCFTELIAPQVFEVEAWNPVQCPQDDMWPCPKKYGGNGFGAAASDRQLRKMKSSLSPSEIVFRGPPILWNADDNAAVSKHRKIFVGGKEVRPEEEA